MRTLFYLAGRSLRGRAVRWLRQIRQPKYAVGSLVLVVWVLLVGVRPILTNVDDLAFMGFVDEFKRFIPLIRFGAAILFAIVLTVMWVVPLGKLGLPFHQAELHILLPAPVTRRNLIQLVMLRAQVPIVLTATIISLLSSDGTGGGFARSWISIWLIFSIFEWSSRFRAMHFLRLRSLRGSAVRVGYGITMAVAATYGIVLVLRLRRVVVEVQQTLLTVMDGGNARLKDILDVLESARQDAVLTILLKPFLWVAGPLMTES
ncbi:MAG: hypothetical protein OEV00_00395 [Acidobacteriota bacterium]|nr:hypothetical protein [Acidobacteriota bacterium]MDH3783763.1 hypothetical protein [Acidobacteriota bacterium]